MSWLRVLWWNVDWQSRSKIDDQIAAVLGLSPQPDVVALGEVDAGRARRWRGVLRPHGYEFARTAPGLGERELRVLLGSRLPIHGVSTVQLRGFWPRASRSLRLASAEGNEFDIHAVHIPNGSANGWVKIDHLRAVRRAFELAHPVPQILCGDFNTPQREIGRRIITFGQTVDGDLRSRPSSPKQVPWDALEWDRGERAVLEGLPDQCGMPDVFRKHHPRRIEATWVPRGLDEDRGRRLDHLFASRSFEIDGCEHIHDWRKRGWSDHSALVADLRLD